MRNAHRLRLGIRLAAAAALTACAGNAVDPHPGPSPALIALPRDLSSSEQAVIGASNAFSFGLWRTINAAQRDSNVFVSPLSASFAMGMTLNGAAGATADEMRSALQFGDASMADINAGYRSLIDLLTSLDPSTTMQIANAIFYRQDFPFNQRFLDDTHSYFDAEVASQDFTDAVATLAAINGWANDKTNGRISHVLDAIDSQDVMFLLNAIYFKGTWRERFDPADTRDAPFHLASGGVQPARLMARQGMMPYAETEAYQAVDLAYGDSAFSMTVLLPKAGTDVDALAESLTPDSWSTLAASFHPQEVDLQLPKVTLSWKRSLIGDMAALGMRLAFQDGLADFTGMSPRGRDLYIALLQQNTFVTIDEEGTEAAAVTTVGMRVTSASLVTVMHVDRPFVFVIRERLSGTVLFMGKIVSIGE